MTIAKPPPPPPRFARDLPAPEVTRADRTWAEVLTLAGYPTDVVVVDFEGYFDPTYHMAGTGDGLTTIEYVMDRRFELLSCAFTFMGANDDPNEYQESTIVQVGEELITTTLGALQKKYGQNLERCTLSFHNAMFDALILARRYNLYPPYIVDTLNLARHWNSRTRNGLKDLAARENLPAKGDTMKFSGLGFRRRWMRAKGRGKRGPKMPVQRPQITEDQVKALVEYNRNDNLRQWEIFTRYLPRLSNPIVELKLMKHTLDMWLKPTLTVDYAKGEEILTAMKGEVERVMAPLGVTPAEISGDKSFKNLLVPALEAAGDDPQKYFKPCKVCAACPSGRMLALAKDDPQRELLHKHSDEKVRQLIEARSALDSWPGHMARVNRIMRVAKADGDRLPVPVKYHGAHTGRWSGGEKINLQNLPKDGLLALIRNMIVAPEGQTLVIVDASQIEARVLAWIAGQDDLCAKFAAGQEIYCDFATKVLGQAVVKPNGWMDANTLKWNKWARNSIGKVGILGCGYGMGTDRIFEYAKGEITIEQADQIKVTYRNENKAIVKFWSDIEKAFLYTAKYKRACNLPRGLSFHALPDCDVVITLPNGRELKYHKIKISSDGRRETFEIWNDKEKHWEYAWGGVLVENVVQAMSRDILAECVLRIDGRGIPVALHAHDEVVAPVPERDGDLALQSCINEMARCPSWAEGCPLGAEGQLSQMYLK